MRLERVVQLSQQRVHRAKGARATNASTVVIACVSLRNNQGRGRTTVPHLQCTTMGGLGA